MLFIVTLNVIIQTDVDSTSMFTSIVELDFSLLCKKLSVDDLNLFY